MDALLLSRLQFAVTIGFHYIYPPLSIGLGLILVIMEGLYLKTRDKVYRDMARFWVKIFGLTFAIGVATGVVMEFEFGTNWATYSRYVGDVFGSPLAAEGVFAFFLESGFLGLLLFGWNRLKPAMHFFATLMVCIGAHISALWIVVAGSWMQTPAGYHIVGEGMEARAEIVDFWAMVFNPSMVTRISHVVMGCWQAGAFLVLSVSAYYLLKNKHVDFAKKSMKIALVVAAVAGLGQLDTGHRSAMVVSKYQPAKLAAFEGHYPSSAKASLYLFGWVDENNEKVYGPAIPGMLSFLVYQDFNHPVTGLRAFKKEDRPPVNIVFQTYHLMIMIGMALIALTFWAIFLWWRKKLFSHSLILKLMIPSVLLPQIANQVGWITAEVGRQPWIVYGLLRTSDALSKTVTANVVLSSLIIFTIVYIVLFALFLYLMNKKIQQGPAGT